MNSMDFDNFIGCIVDILRQWNMYSHIRDTHVTAAVAIINNMNPVDWEVVPTPIALYFWPIHASVPITQTFIEF